MREITVETTGNFMLVDPISRKEIEPGKENTVPHTTFVQERLDNGDLREAKAEKPKRKTKGRDRRRGRCCCEPPKRRRPTRTPLLQLPPKRRRPTRTLLLQPSRRGS
jgi:hypothetical protein